MRGERQQRGTVDRSLGTRRALTVLTADYLASGEQLETRPHRRPCDCVACQQWALELVVFGALVDGDS